MPTNSMAARLWIHRKWTFALARYIRGSSAPLHYKWHTYNCRRYIHEEMKQIPLNQSGTKDFEQLLRNSRFVSCGDSPVGQKAIAKIIEEVGDDLYVDFGAKFHAVVPRPSKRGSEYRKGKWVEVIIEDLEISEHFLGANKDTSLLEAKVRLIGFAQERQ